ncbi:MAG: ABC transporter ATP-binding protein/permease [Hyphomonadaceae bacterium]|nr:ABC transporter ATP-binding protein/permease [Hyphomonadaceae bacterium]
MYRWFETRIDPFPDEPPARPPETLLAFYAFFIRPVWPAFALLLAAGFVGSLIEVSLLAFVGNLVDMMKGAQSPGHFFDDHGPMLLFMAFVALIARPLVSTAHELIKNQIIAGPVTSRVRWLTHRYVLRQSLGFFQNDFAGRVANKVMQAAPALRESVVQVIDAIWYAVVQWVGAAVIFAAADPRLLVPLVLWLVIYIAALFVFVPRIKERSTEAAEARSMLVGRIVDSYTNILTVKLFAHAEREDTYARGALEEQMAKWQASLRLVTTMDLVLYSLNGLLIVSASGLAIWLWSHDAVSIGAVAVVTGLVMRIVAMSGWILWVVAGIFENMGVVQEGMETIARVNQVVDRPDSKALMVSHGDIRFEQVSFHYGQPMGAGTSRPGGVIHDFTLHIGAGEKVGLVGRSGAGKSTLVNLLLRFYDLEAGRILIDGQDIAHVTQNSLRAQIGMVTQDTSLLHRSVRDNILYGRPEAGEAAAIAAARKAQADDFIAGLEDLRGRKGYNAHVGERGVKLSGGQRQRIAMARVLLKDAPILILDEATSALDSEVEAAIQEQLYNLMTGKTVIAIAHRLSTIAAMDRLVILDKGRIVEEGSHSALLKRGGLYADLWERQSGGFLAEAVAAE